jgi:UDP-N-acetyl-D-glucosamine dehydrogenase
MKTKSPFGDIYEYYLDDKKEIEKLNSFVNNQRKNIVVQGLGFVGAAMVAALSNAKNAYGDPIYNVIGVDLPDEKNFWKIAMTNCYKPPIVSTDKNVIEAYLFAGEQGNMIATFSEYAYALADVVVVDIHLDIKKTKLGSVKDYYFTYDNYKNALNSVAENVKEDVLILIETTVPPGTTKKVIQPIFKNALEKRGMNTSKYYLAHSYERVMPGPNYYNSIVNFYRVFSGIDERSKIKTRAFLESFINTDEYPLTELHSTNASEIAKVLENSYRAMNIAFMKEWTAFAQTSDVNF